MTGASHRPGDSRLVLPPLYPIIDIDLCRMRAVDPLWLARASVDGGATLLQVRQKGRHGAGALLVQLIREIVEGGHAAGALVIINDRADLAAMTGAGGVHLGQQDLPPSAARRVAGEQAIIGQSTHTREQIDRALEGVADYVAVGPVLATTTKDTGYEPQGLEIIRYAARRGKPIVAIGGLTLVTARSALDAGADSVAVISDLLSGPDPASRIREFLKNC